MQDLKLLMILAFLGLFVPAFAQTDSNVVKVDTAFRNPGTRINSKDTIRRDSARLNGAPARNAPQAKKNEVVKDSARLALEAMPRKAALRSLIVPGLGQIYNKRWWKVPLVYGGYVGIGLVYEFNQRYYKEMLREAKARTDTSLHIPLNPKYVNADVEGIIRAKDYYRRNRDLSILAAFAFHAFQVIDAYVDAKFFRYDIGDELTLKVVPSFQPQSIYNAYTPVPTLKLQLSL